MSELEAPTNAEGFISNLLSANEKWAQRVNQTFPQYFPDPLRKQAPKILWIGCSDSRVQESDATTALPGTIFTHRNIANQFHLNDDSALSVFAYAVKVLGVRHVAVVGHEHCGGVITAVEEALHPPSQDQIERHHALCDSLHHHTHTHTSDHRCPHDKHSKDPNDAITRWLTPLVHRIKTLVLPPDEQKAVRVAMEENVKMQVGNVGELDAWVQENVEERVWVHGWVYDFSTGFIRDLDVTRELGTCGEA